MTGRRHHYLPRFLQRPFAFLRKGKNFYVHAHHKTHGTYGTNVMEIGQELDFYGGPEEGSLDDAITDGEKQLALTVNRLNANEQVEAIHMATLLSALSIRTKAMRNAFADMMPPLIITARTRLLNGKRLQSELRESLRDPKKRRNLIYEQIRKDYGHFDREQQAKLYGKMIPKWDIFVQENEENLIREMRSIIHHLTETMEHEAKKIAEKAFLAALTKDPESLVRAQRIAEELTFEIFETPPGEHLILGDCGPAAIFTDGKPRLVLGAIEEGVEIDMIFLPVSPNRCLIGRRASHTKNLGSSDFNKISASLSHEFFISDQGDIDNLANLRQTIGSLAPIATEEEIYQLIAAD